MTCDHLANHTAHRAGGAVHVGSRVRVLAPWGEDEYVIVPPQSADPQHGRISLLSPVGAALLDQRPGDVVSVRTPDGAQSLALLDVTPPEATPPPPVGGRD
jgi:transcription elongation GreA/GreB family factor